MPWRRFSASMLLPVLQLVSLWWTFCLIECHGDFFISYPFIRLHKCLMQ